jgi:hypothetical protein
MRSLTMTIHELVTLLNTLEPDHEVFVALFKTDGTGESFDIEAVRDHHGHAQLDVYEEEDGFDEEEGNGTVRGENAVTTPAAAEAAAEAFLDLCERRGLTEEEKDLMWNAMAFLCYEQVQHRQGPFYEAIKPLLADGEA